MAAGGPGDHPLSDILDYNLEVYGRECDDLIREISKYASQEDMLETFAATPTILLQKRLPYKVTI